MPFRLQWPFPKRGVAVFDTLKYSRILESTGVPREQAEAHVRIISEIVEGELATKQDLRELEYRMLIKMGALMTTLLATAVAILKLS